MFVNAIKKVNGAIFPIFRSEPTPQANSYYTAIVGTGFFIGPDGMFASLAHVFDGATAKTQFHFFGVLPEGVRISPLQIVEAARDQGHDIFIGKIAIDTPNFIRLSKTAEIGQSVCMAGYASLALPNDDKEKADVKYRRPYFQPSFVIDHFTSPIDCGIGENRTYDGFLLRDLCLRGMSGGTVFDIDGAALGICGATLQRSSSDGISQLLVQNSIVINSEWIFKLSQAMDTNPIRPRVP